MNIIKPIVIDDTALEASSVPETDGVGEWDSGTTYSVGQIVRVTGTTHKTYESTQGGNSNRNPVTDDGTWWTELGATNRWKAFDQKLSDQVAQANSISYEIRLASLVTGIAFFNVEADTIRVQVFDDTDQQVFDQTLSSASSTQVETWYGYFYDNFDQAAEQLFLDQPGVQDLPGYEGYKATIILTRTGSTAKVGQIVLGRLMVLGRTVPGTNFGLRDFSVKNTDAFGNAVLTVRGFSRETNFECVFPTLGSQRIAGILDGLRATPIVWMANASTVENVAALGTVTYGWLDDYNVSQEAKNSSVSISVKGLV